ncbi:MAG: ABC transporter permease [Alphaproteobacteria bacterium 64-6]|jgi:ABC-2 type transport system permease protein|uniref:ABC transporter permease n=1 Tax=Hyphomicrobium sp. CS1BSMeth3 TaxID=1892844 RepID=UPI00093160FD|nr:ABC transporter permease [Hyphomicrobium sp. CS1BSMeth3]MBN9272133.1 ABC transporter permease [Mesorhizobium sp.]OJU22293.1 MAG: ABC transporter permease [Alphaproteobacteria bacterium 64-6]
MRRWMENAFRLGIKEFASLSRDVVMVVLIAYVFTFAVYSEATAMRTDVNDAKVAVIDGDRSTLSGRIKDALRPPHFRPPVEIDRSSLDRLMDKGVFIFILDIPHGLEADFLGGRNPAIQVNVDATTISQAGVGTAYIQEIIARETASYLKHDRAETLVPVNTVIRAMFNPNLEALTFTSSMGVINNVTILAIILVGAAVMREREHGTIEHLLVMPVSASEIIAGKVWANGLVILLAAAFSLHVVVEVVLRTRIVGSIELFLVGTAIYLFAVTSLGILLATVANSMPQFALLSIPVFVLMFLLSGAFTPFESMPRALQAIMDLSPSTHFVRFAQAVLYRGAGIDVVWRDLLIMVGLGAAFVVVALYRFKAMLARQS